MHYLVHAGWGNFHHIEAPTDTEAAAVAARWAADHGNDDIPLEIYREVRTSPLPPKDRRS